MQAVVNEAIMNLSFLLAGLGGVLIGLALIWCIRRLIGYRQKGVSCFVSYNFTTAYSNEVGSGNAQAFLPTYPPTVEDIRNLEVELMGLSDNYTSLVIQNIFRLKQEV
jgi:hypothetical protein